MKSNILFPRINTTITVTPEERLMRENKDIIDAGFKMDEQEVSLLQFDRIETAVTKLKAAFALEAKRKILTAATVAEVGQYTKQYLIDKGLGKENSQSIDKNYLRRVVGKVSRDQISHLISATEHVFSIDYISPALEYLTRTIDHELEQKQNRENSCQSNLNASVTTTGLFSSTEQKHEETEQMTQAPLIDEENDDTSPEESVTTVRHRRGYSAVFK